MKNRLFLLAMGIVFIAAFSFSVIQAQQPGGRGGGAPAGPERLGFRVAPPVYQANCGTCHGTTGSIINGKIAPSIGELQEYSTERIYDVLNKATTAPHAGSFSDLQKKQFAEFL